MMAERKLAFSTRAYGGGTVKPAHFFKIFLIVQQPTTNYQHQMMIIGQRESIENHLFNNPSLQLYIL